MNLVQASIDISAAQAHCATVNAMPRMALADLGLVGKTVLTEALQGPVLRPWRVERIARTGILTLTGYSTLDEAALTSRLEAALPSLRAALTGILSVPVVRPEATLRFSLDLCPTVRVTGHGERDAFLYRLDKEGAPEAGPLDRSTVYREYLAAHLKGADLLDARLVSFQLKKMVRPRADRSFHSRTLPAARLEGVVRVTDPDAFKAQVAQGIGRQRAYGYGMLRYARAA
jgi:CRISPR system Cascade subunit CasE